MKKIELLAPAKNTEAGIAAINFGADAVYIGAPKFGARAAAGNTIDDIRRLADYAHKYYSKVYVTLNTILFDNELEEANNIIHKVYNEGVDAVIIQDMGILEMDLPPIPIFASTQTHNHTWQKVKFLEDTGLQRIILARELSINQIKEIKAKTNIDLEFFIHGALCVSYSGQCYFSHAIDKESANRGACAQPCRAYYSLIDSQGKTLIKNKHLLSLKDFNLTQHITELLEAGISSLKIEGRLKDLDYVKNITAHYRLIVDKFLNAHLEYTKASSGKVNLDFTPDPEKTFNRGYSSYFINGRNKGIASPDTQKSIGKSIGKVKSVHHNYFIIDSYESINNGDGICFFDKNGKLQGTKINKSEKKAIYPESISYLETGMEVFRNYDHEFSKQLSSSKTERKVSASLCISETPEGILVLANDEDRNEVKWEYPVNKEIAKNPELAIKNIQTQLTKSGDSIFSITKIECNLDKPLFFAISVLNEIRRKSIDLLYAERLQNYKRELFQLQKSMHPYPEDHLNYKGNVLNKKAIEFYARHGVKAIENAFESVSNFANKEIMATKHCIKYQMGACEKYEKTPIKLSEPIFLQDNNRTYALEFNCKECIMKILLKGD